VSRHLQLVATWKWPCNSYLLRQEDGWVAQNHWELFPRLERTDRTPVVWIISLHYLYPPERDIRLDKHHALLKHRRLFTLGQTTWNEWLCLPFTYFDRFLWNLTQGRPCECCWVNLFVLMVRKYKNNFRPEEACMSTYSLQAFVFPMFFFSGPPVGLNRHCIDRFQFRPSWGGWRQLLRLSGGPCMVLSASCCWISMAIKEK